MQVWRGEHYACTHSEYLQVKRQLMAEMHGGPAAAAAAGDGEGDCGPRSWAELTSEEQGKLLKERLKKYTQKVSKQALTESFQHRLTSCADSYLATIMHPKMALASAPRVPGTVWLRVMLMTHRR
jgi:hypothetical protein